MAQLLRQVDHHERTLNAAEIGAVISQTLAREALAAEQARSLDKLSSATTLIYRGQSGPGPFGQVGRAVPLFLARFNGASL